jgi:Zn-finger nucleic acid-binding protein
MPRSNSEVPSIEQPQTRIGMHVPETLRMGWLTHPSGVPIPDGRRIPCLMLRGMWMDRFELSVVSRVIVEVESKRITLTLDETPIPAPYRNLDHARGRVVEQRVRLSTRCRNNGEWFDIAVCHPGRVASQSTADPVSNTQLWHDRGERALFFQWSCLRRTRHPYQRSTGA